LAFSPDSRFIAATGEAYANGTRIVNKHSFAVWNAASGELVNHYLYDRSIGQNLYWMPGGKQLLSIRSGPTNTYQVVLTDIQTGKQRELFLTPLLPGLTTELARQIVVSADRRHLVLVSRSTGTVFVYRLEDLASK